MSILTTSLWDKPKYNDGINNNSKYFSHIHRRLPLDNCIFGVTSLGRFKVRCTYVRIPVCSSHHKLVKRSGMVRGRKVARSTYRIDPGYVKGPEYGNVSLVG